MNTYLASTNVNAAVNVMHAYVVPVLQGMCVFASLICVFFLVNGGIRYMTSSGHPAKLESAKKVIRGALIGLVIVLAAGALSAILSHAYGHVDPTTATKLPALTSIKPSSSPISLAGVIIKAVTGLLNNIIQTAAVPFLKALAYFTTSTPLIADNSSVFNLWLVIVGMTDAIFVLVIALIGFHVMSASTFGFEEIELKHILPRIALVFALINSSVFIIDGFIGLSNAMISALRASFSQQPVWNVLTNVTNQISGYGMAAMLIMVAFLIISVILLVYYVGRIVTLYIGAVLSPLILLLWLIPSCRDFAINAAKTYLATIFVLFVHTVILDLAASIFTGMSVGSATHSVDPLMAMIIGLATLMALLRTQGVMMQLSYASLGARTARKLGDKLVIGTSYLADNLGVSDLRERQRMGALIPRRDPPAYRASATQLAKTNIPSSASRQASGPKTATTKSKSRSTAIKKSLEKV